MNGKERLYWQENQAGHVFISDVISPVKPGYQKFSTVTPSKMDRIFAKIDKQEKIRHSRLTEETFNRDKAFMEQNLSNIRAKLANSDNEAEKDMLRAWLKAFNNKMDRLMKNTVYGIAAMQEAPAPIPAENPMLTVDDIRLGKLELMKPASEAIQ